MHENNYREYKRTGTEKRKSDHIKSGGGRRKKESRRMKRLRRRRRLLIAAMLAVLLLPAGGILLFLNMHPLFLKQDVIEQELQGSFDPAENIRYVFGGNPEQVRTEGDVDLTAMTLQCLEPYQEEENVKDTIDRGVEFLADAQDADGGYTAYGDKSSESVSQTIIALSTYGIDCNEDERFQKDGKGLYDTLMTYYQKDGSFSHTEDGDSDPMATDQAFCAMVAYERCQNKENSFYNMTDHR